MKDPTVKQYIDDQAEAVAIAMELQDDTPTEYVMRVGALNAALAINSMRLNDEDDAGDAAQVVSDAKLIEKYLKGEI